jgi:hypothetical protein
VRFAARQTPYRRGEPMRLPAAGAVQALRRRFVLGLCLSRAMVRDSFPRTYARNALKPHFVGTPSSRGLLRRASPSSRPLLPPHRLGHGGWRRWGPSPDRATTAAPGRGAKDHGQRSWGTTPHPVVKRFGVSDWWCAFWGRSRRPELTLIDELFFVSISSTKARDRSETVGSLIHSPVCDLGQWNRLLRASVRQHRRVLGDCLWHRVGWIGFDAAAVFGSERLSPSVRERVRTGKTYQGTAQVAARICSKPPSYVWELRPECLFSRVSRLSGHTTKTSVISVAYRL